jgi:hypothetical protein
MLDVARQRATEAALHNVRFEQPDAPGPFSLSDPDRITALLVDAGYEDVEVTGLAEPLWFGHDAEDAFAFVLGLLGWMLHGRDDSAKRIALDALRTTLAAHERAEGVLFESGTWLTSARRR